MQDLIHYVAESHYGGGVDKGFRYRNEQKKLKDIGKKLCRNLEETPLILFLNKRDPHLAWFREACGEWDSLRAPHHHLS